MARDGVMVRAEELARAVQLQAVASYENTFVEEAVLAGVADLLERMGYAEADAVEALLIMQVATAWLVLQGEQKRLESVTSGSYSLREADALDRRVSRAHSRWIRATESLEKVRALRRVTDVRTRRQAANWSEGHRVEEARYALVAPKGSNQTSLGSSAGG